MTNENRISLALSFVSGFVDTAGFIALFSLFTAHVTGNLVLAGASLADSGGYGNLLGKLLMLPVFVFSVAFTSYGIKYKGATIRQLVWIEALCIGCFAITGSLLLKQGASPLDSHISMVASFAVIGMAIQNAYMRKLLSSYTPNTVMTGNFTQFSIDLFNLADYYFYRRRRAAPVMIEPVWNSFRKFGLVLMGFLAGCAAGAYLVKWLGLACCMLPALILVWVSLDHAFDRKGS